MVGIKPASAIGAYDATSIWTSGKVLWATMTLPKMRPQEGHADRGGATNRNRQTQADMNVKPMQTASLSSSLPTI